MRPDRIERAIRRCYRTLLVIYPREFRDAMGLDIEETFIDRLRAARPSGAFTTVAFLLVAIADAVGGGLVERLDALWSPGMFHWQDVRYAVRLLRKSPALTLLIITVLGGGLGVSIFTFSFLYTAMLRPIPVRDGDRIVRVTATAGPAAIGLDIADLARMRESLTGFADVGAFTSRDLVAGDDPSQPGRVLGATAAEWNIFRTTGTNAALGRTFRREDADRSGEPVVVLSHRTWQTAFGGDSMLVGRTIALNGVATRVIGVMPPGYGFPVAADAWVPLTDDVLGSLTPGQLSVDLYARLRDGIDMNSAAAQVQAVLDRTLAARPAPLGDAPNAATAQPKSSRERVVAHVETFPRAQLGEEGPLMFAVLNLLAALILLLACVNVINLLLARANDRAREMAVRLALGASRGRLIVQSLWESAMLTLAGGALATGIAAWALSAINGWAHAHIPGNLAFWWVWRLDRPALVATGAFVTVTMAVLGGVVAARATNVRISAVLQDSTARGGHRRQSRVARTLVVTQVATVSVLMFFGVMSAIVAHRVTRVDLGYDTANLMSAPVVPQPERFETAPKRLALYESVVTSLAQAREIESSALESMVAELNDARGSDRIELERGGSGGGARAFIRGTLGPLAPLGTAIQDGRAFDTRDSERGAPTAIVSRSFATRYWPGMSPVGKEVRLAGAGESEWRTIVGVATDVPLGNPLARDRSRLAVYVPLTQHDVPAAQLVFRHRGNESAAVANVYRVLAAADPLATPPHVASFAEIVDTTSLMARAVTKLFALCFGFALLLAVSGTYGLMAQSIGSRTREIGVRRALGATDAGIVALLLGQGGRQLGVGAAIALPVLVVIGVGFSKFVPIGTGLAVTTGVLVAATIVAVVLAATYLPTRRALRVSPRQALWE